MKITHKHLQDLRDCELYKSILPRYQKNIEWIFKEYIKLTESENINTKIYFVTPMKDGSVTIHSPIEMDVNRRRLLNLNVVDFEFGLQMITDEFMPFFGENEIALFNGARFVDEMDDGDLCLIKHSESKKHYLVTKEETGFFTLDCNFFCAYHEAEIKGALVNIETT